MDVTLPPALEKFVEETVRAGHFNSVSELIGFSLKLLDERDQIRHQTTKELRQELKIAIEQIREDKFVESKQKRRLQIIAIELIKRGCADGNYLVYQHLIN